MNRSILACLLGLGVAACTGGERNQTGECPPDEACSPLTPNGLHFVGQSLVGVPLLAQPKTTAIDGTQMIRLYYGGPGGTATDTPFDLPFAAMADNGDALEVVTTGSTSVVIGGVGAGADLLRITEADNDLLYDRYEVDAAALDTIELIPGTFEASERTQTIGFYRGEVTIGFALYSASDVRLVDDSMTLDAGLGVQVTRGDWDTFTFADLAPGVHSPTLTAAGRAGAFDLHVVDAITQILPLRDTFPATIRPGDQGEVCFHAEGGGRDAIFGLPWAFSSTGAVSPLISLFANCFAIQVNQPGDFSVTAMTLGQMATVTFTAVAAGATKPTRDREDAAAPVRIAPEGDTRGERAQLAQP